MIHMHDVARATDRERLERAASHVALRSRDDEELEGSSLRANFGNALIRAGTRLVPPAGAVRQPQPNPPC